MNIVGKLKRTKIYKSYNSFKWRERAISNGNECPDKTYYVVRRFGGNAGLFSYVTSNLGEIKYAIGKGWEPIVDMQNIPSLLMETDKLRKANAWEYYFEQPYNIGLDRISKARNVVLGNAIKLKNFPGHSIIDNQEELKMWRKIASKYLRIRPELEERINQYIEKHFEQDKVLGVLCRGTDYVQSKPKGHPVQPSADEVIGKCCEVISKYGCNKIYLATEDNDIYLKFVNKFGQDKIYNYQQVFYTVKSGQNINETANKNENCEARNQNYLVSIGILSRCNYLVAGAAGGTYGALLMSKGYDYQFIFDKGLYD